MSYATAGLIQFLSRAAIGTPLLYILLQLGILIHDLYVFIGGNLSSHLKSGQHI